METFQRYTPLGLYRRRRREHFKEQLKNLKLVVDWTVWVYLLVPGLLYLGGWYVSSWTKPLPSWATGITLPTLTGLIDIVILTGGVLIFVEEADVLFLKSRPLWMRTLMKQGMYRACLQHLGKMIAIMALTAPLWSRVYDMSFIQMALIAVWFGAVASFQAIVLHMTKVRHTGWRRWIRMIPLAAAMGIMTVIATSWMHTQTWRMMLGTVLVMLLVITVGQMRLIMKGTFEGDVREDLRGRLKLTALLLSRSVTKPKAPRTRTMIFRKPRKLLRNRSIANRTAETAFKAFFRNSSTMKLYLQLGGLSIVAVALPPFPVNAIVCVLLMIMLSVLFYRSWDVFATSDYIQLVSYDTEALNQAAQTMVRMLFIPLGILMGFSLGAAWLGWLEGVVTAAAVVALGLFILSITGWIRSLRSD
ncbi:ABC transporter permease [Paenibacillus sp. JNUCC31]|uniref:ABC transporter permease n=1 Tax=Paenibacillus sp. JNUCC-31 TaxID=2777983 RepID=UPI001783B659|nr:ABC transporter permease [Paenibacillus sp. JNUCC-31]QOS76767.1 ABC transporter permease [Paenibacillus sp. JNUCC-31]